MKVFVFFVAILLAAAVKASPLNVEEIDGEIVNNEIDAEVQVDPLAELRAEVDSIPESYSVDEDEEKDELTAEDEEKDELTAEDEEKDELTAEDEEKDESTAEDEEKDESAAEEIVQENEVESEDSETNEESESAGVPYEEDGKALQVEEKPKLTPEQMEKTYGIDIPLCAANDNQRMPMHLSHLKNCGQFYKCYNGRGYLMDCPAGEHWSVHLNRCDYPSLARCKMNGSYQFKIKKTKPVQASDQVEEEEDKPETGDFEIDPRCEGSDPFKPMHYKHVSDCSKFYKCYMGKAYVIKCPRGQQWAQAMNRCEHPSIARCTIRPSAVKPAVIKPAQAMEESDSDESYEEYESYYDDGPTIADDPDFMVDDVRCLPDDPDIFHPVQFTHPTDCTMFYKCFDHRAYKIQCPSGLHYSVKGEQCDYPEDAQCQVGAMMAQAQETPYTPTIPACPQNENVNFPVEGSFTRYFNCIGGLAYLMECQAEEIFNPMSRNCEKFQMSQYPMMPMMPDFSGNMQQMPGWMQQFPGVMPQYPGMQFPQFPQMPNIPPQMPIPEPQVPNTRPIQRPRPQTPTVERPEFPSWMPVPNPNVQLPDMPNSEKPSHEKPTDKNEFNYQSGKQNSRCPSADNPSKPQHLSHENDCKKFYKCFNGRAFSMECPDSQEWSSDLQRCDFHQFANCDPVELIKKKIQA